MPHAPGTPLPSSCRRRQWNSPSLSTRRRSHRRAIRVRLPTTRKCCVWLGLSTLRVSGNRSGTGEARRGHDLDPGNREFAPTGGCRVKAAFGDLRRSSLSLGMMPEEIQEMIGSKQRGLTALLALLLATSLIFAGVAPHAAVFSDKHTPYARDGGGKPVALAGRTPQVAFPRNDTDASPRLLDAPPLAAFSLGLFQARESAATWTSSKTPSRLPSKLRTTSRPREPPSAA